MKKLGWLLAGLLGSLLLLVGGWLTVQRQTPSTAYWLLAGRHGDGVGRAFYGYYLFGPDGQPLRRIGEASAASNQTWFVAWSPDGRAVFHRTASGFLGNPPGLYLTEVTSGDTRLVIQAEVGTLAIEMALSPDGRWYAANLPGPAGQRVLYRFDTAGRNVQRLLAYQMSAATRHSPSAVAWSADGGWLYFSDGETRYQARPDGSQQQIRADDAPHRRIQAPRSEAQVIQHAPGQSWQLVTRDVTQPLPLEDFEQHAVMAWLPSDWLLVWATGPDSRALNYYRMRPDGSQMATLYQREPGDSFLASPFWSADGRYVYLMVQQQAARRVYRVDVQTLGVQRVIDDFSPMYNRPFTESQPGDPLYFYWFREAGWLVYEQQASRGYTRYIKVRPDGSGRQVLFDERRFNLNAFPSPDGAWLMLTYTSGYPQNRVYPRVVERIHLSSPTRDRFDIPRGTVITLSAPYEQPFNGWLPLASGATLLGLAGWGVYRRRG